MRGGGGENVKPSTSAQSKSLCRGTRACLHSLLGPKDDANKVDHGGEAGIGLLVARGDASKRFDLTEEVFDEMTPLVFLPVMRGMPACALAKRNDGLDLVARQALAQPVGIERLVADNGQAIDASHKSVEAGDVVSLSRQQYETDQIAKRIYERRNLRRRAAPRLADGLFLGPPFAPVPC